jgi:rod shape determining protein RodA
MLAFVIWRGLRIAANAGDRSERWSRPGGVLVRLPGFRQHRHDDGIMPVTRLPLMFVSYGGSSMFAT